EVELTGGDAQRAARVVGEVPPLARVLARLEPEGAVGPKTADTGQVRASVPVDRRQPARMSIRTARLRRLGQALCQAGRDSGPVQQGRPITGVRQIIAV